MNITHSIKLIANRSFFSRLLFAHILFKSKFAFCFRFTSNRSTLYIVINSCSQYPIKHLDLFSILFCTINSLFVCFVDHHNSTVLQSQLVEIPNKKRTSFSLTVTLYVHVEYFQAANVFNRFCSTTVSQL